MQFPPLRFLVLDTETTGFVPKIHRVMEYASALIEGGKVTHEFEQLLELPEGAEIPDAVQVLTRIYPEDLVDKPTFDQIQPKIEAMLTDDTIIVGQNVQFDIGMLRGEGLDLSARPWIDTAMLASIVFPELHSYSLGYVSKALKLDHNPPHRALGDVRATVQFLSRCWQRLSELPVTDCARIRELSERGPAGYRMLFAALHTKETKRPGWLSVSTEKKSIAKDIQIPPPEDGVQLREEPMDHTFISSVLAGLSGQTWCAVKNIEAAVGRHPETSVLTVLYPPEFLVSGTSRKAFLEQTAFTPDELTLAIKLELYQPIVRGDLPIHGDEYSVFSGKLAADAESPEYATLRKKAEAGPTILSHQHLLSICGDADTPLPKSLHLLVDDASMLEDTATNAYAWTCHIPSLRASAQGNALLMKCVDLIELFAERVRAETDLRYLAPSDLQSKECSELKKTLASVLDASMPSQARRALQELLLILDPANLAGRFAWVESMKDGSKTIKSVPEDIAGLLEARLYSAVHTTLLIPPKSSMTLATIVPGSATAHTLDVELPAPVFTLSMPVGESLESMLQAPQGKTLLIVPSKRTIEDVFVRHTERLEEEGVTLLCQGFSGGASRMQAEFCIAKAPAVMVMTPWMYEGLDLEPDTVDRLALQSLPFDHPAHAVVSRRALRFRDGFSEYSLPRLQHRLFRLLRTFSRHAKPGAGFQILDDRLRTKEYGKRTAKLLESFFAKTPASDPGVAPKANSAPVRKTSQKSGEGQMSLL